VQCGLAFVPRRGHARFCSARCEITWETGNAGAPAPRAGPAAGGPALEWPLAAMRAATMRVSLCRPAGRAQALAVAGEAVRQVMITDAHLARHYPDAYDAVLASHDLAGQAQAEGTLAGLRFARNQMSAGPGDAEFIDPWAGGPPVSTLAAWQWRPAPEPATSPIPPPARERQMSQYRAYQAYVARRSVGEVFGQAVAFLAAVATSAARTP
jgi:hypothetical protein